MSRQPIWTIFILLIASIFTAGLYHGLSLFKRDETGLSLGIAFSVAEDEGLEFESRNECPTERAYLEQGLSVLPPILREQRWRRSQDYQVGCVHLALTSVKQIDSRTQYHSCVQGKVTRAKSPCATEALVHSIDNAVADIADCFELSSRELLSAVVASQAINFGVEKEAVLAQVEDADLIVSVSHLAYRDSCQRLSLLSRHQIFKTGDPSLMECQALQLPFRRMIAVGAKLKEAQSRFESEWSQLDLDARADDANINDVEQSRAKAWLSLASLVAGEDYAIASARDFITQALERKPASADPLTPRWKEVAKERLPKSAVDFVDRLENWVSLAETSSLRARGCWPEALLESNEAAR